MQKLSVSGLTPYQGETTAIPGKEAATVVEAKAFNHRRELTRSSLDRKQLFRRHVALKRFRQASVLVAIPTSPTRCRLLPTFAEITP